MGCFPLKDEKAFTNASQKFREKYRRKQTWLDKGSECYNGSMKSWLQDNDAECIQHIMKKVYCC